MMRATLAACAVMIATPAMAAPSVQQLAECMSYNSPLATPVMKEQLYTAGTVSGRIADRSGQSKQVIAAAQKLADDLNAHPAKVHAFFDQHTKPCGAIVTTEANAPARADEAERALLEAHRATGVQR
jgi:hypothetical protein